MRRKTRKDLDADVLAWGVIGAIFGGVSLGLWATLLWSGIH
jgi:hypothetical protein